MLVRSLAATLWVAAAAAGQAGPFDGPGAFRPDQLRAPLSAPAAASFALRAVPSHTHVTAGRTFHVAVVCDLADGWVYYSPDPGPVAQAASLRVQAGPMRAGESLWPKDKPKSADYGDGPVVNHTYGGRFVIFAALTVPPDAPPGPVQVRLSPRGQICRDVCVPLEGHNELSAVADVTVGAETVANPEWTSDLTTALEHAMRSEQLRDLHLSGISRPRPGVAGASRPGAPPASEASDLGLWAGLALALLAGLTLNIMPCVLPVIPLRIYSLVKTAGESRRRYVTLGLAFAAGIVLFFVGLAAASAGFKLLWQRAINLNAYFQIAAVRVALAMVLLALAANLFGLFEVTVPSRIAGAGPRKSGHAPAVGMGLMMAVLSLPCSFWLMALAVAWAQLQPLWLGTAAIVLIGVGMAAPHALLAAFPQTLKLLPKPGRWMELFKKTMGFLLLPAVLYLLSTLAEGAEWTFLVAGFGVALAFALWMWGSWVRFDDPPRRKLIVRGVAAAVVAVCGALLLPRPAPPAVRFEDFDAARIESARQAGRTVVVKVTAAWCTECRILERTVYNSQRVARAFRDNSVVAIKADVTDGDSPAGRWVETNHGASAPLTIIYPGRGAPTFLVGRFAKSRLLSRLRCGPETPTAP